MSSRPAKRQVALWGYGRLGKDFFKSQMSRTFKPFDIMAVFDNSVGVKEKHMLEGGIPLLNPESLAQEYSRGSFDGVIISVGNATTKKEISQHLNELGIPIASNILRDELHKIESFEGATSQALPGGFELHEYSGIYGSFSPLFPGQVSLFLFDAKARLLADNWFSDAFDWDPYFELCTPCLNIEESSTVRLAGEYCIVARAFGTNYWHFTYQHLDQIVLMEQEGFKGTYLLPRSRAAEQLVDLFGLDRERIIWLDELKRDRIYQFDRALVVAQELYDFDRSAPLVIEAGRRIAERVEKHDGGTDRYPSRIFVKRIGSRRLLGADKLIEDFGFAAVTPDELSVAEQVRHFQNADIVLTPHGANSTNSLYMRPGSVFIETFGKRYALPLCTRTLKLGGVFYLPVVETPIVDDTSFSNTADYMVDHEVLASVIQAGMALAEKGRQESQERRAW